MDRIALDVHAHLIPLRPEHLAELDGVEAEDGRLRVDGHAVGIDAIYRPERLVAWMEEHGVARALVSAPPPLYRSHLAESQGRSWFAYVNDGLREMCATAAERLVAMTHVPVEHPALALELARATIENDRPYASMGADGRAATLFSDAALDPLWSVLDAAGAFVFLHPGACCDGRLKPFYLENLLGNPMETAVAAAHLLFAGVPGRFPNISFCLAHAGGATPQLAGRWQRGFDTQRPGIDTSLEAPAAAARRFYADSIAHDPDALALAAKTFGAGHMLFGSDWPFPMGLPQPHRQLADCDAELRRRLCVTNAAGILQDP